MSWLHALFGAPRGNQKAAELATAIPDSGRPVQSGLDTMSDARLYSTLATVFACVKVKSDSFSLVPLKVFRKDTDGNSEHVPEHPLQKLIDNPNPIDTTSEIQTDVSSFLDLAGDAYWLLEGGQAKRGGPPAMITPLRPYRMTPIKDAKTRIGSWKYTVGSKSQTFDREEILHFKTFNPVNDFLGQSSMEAAHLAALLDLYAIILNKGFFKHGTQPGVVMTFDEMAGADSVKRAMELFNSKHTGAENAFKARAVAGASKVETTGITLQDMMFPKLREMNKQEIREALGVPPIMVGTMDGSTFANGREQKTKFWGGTMKARFKLVTDRINKGLVPRYHEDGLFVAFDTSAVEAMLADLATFSKIAKDMWDRGALTSNEFRSWMSTGKIPTLGALDGGDQTYLPFSVLPVGQPQKSLVIDARGKTLHLNGNGRDPIDGLFKQLENRIGGLVEVEKADDRKTVIWRRFDKKTRAFEKLFEKAANEMFKEQEKALLDQLEEILARTMPDVDTVRKELASLGLSAEVPDTLDEHYLDVRRGVRRLVPTSMNKSIEEIALIFDALRNGNIAKFRALYSAALLKSGKGALEDLGLKELEFSMTQASVIRFLDEEGARLVTGVDIVTKERIAANIAEGIAEGDNILGLSDRVKETFKANRHRANTIARTESIKSFNFGTLDAYKQSQVVESKSWLTAGDDDVRDSHDEVSTDPIALNQTFDVGSSQLAYPGDPNGEAEDVINCRCTILPHLKKAASFNNNGGARRLEHA